MAFRCRMCGTCCMSMGDCIAVEREIGPFEFECESISTGTPFRAIVDEDKRELFRDITWIKEHPRARLSYQGPAEELRCRTHGASPAQCKYYGWVVMRIIDPGDDPAGRVTSTLALHSDNPVLRDIWEAALREIPEG